MWCLLIILLLGWCGCSPKHSGVYQACSRGECSSVSDRETGWEFDQPQPFYIEEGEGGDIRTQLTIDRIHIRYYAGFFLKLAKLFFVLTTLGRDSQSFANVQRLVVFL